MIKRAMEAREAELLSGNLLIAAVMLDYSSSSLLKKLPMEIKTDGAKAVEELVLRLKGISVSDDLNLDDVDTDCSSTESVASDSDEDIQILRKRDSSADSSLLEVEVEDEVEQLELTVSGRGQISPRNQILTEVKNGLAMLENKDQRKKMKVLEMKKDVDRIKVIKNEYPEVLQEVAILLYTMPVTQVSVERMFSALKLYKTDLRSRLKDDILNAMMILKANM